MVAAAAAAADIEDDGMKATWEYMPAAVAVDLHSPNYL